MRRNNIEEVARAAEERNDFELAGKCRSALRVIESKLMEQNRLIVELVKRINDAPDESTLDLEEVAEAAEERNDFELAGKCYKSALKVIESKLTEQNKLITELVRRINDSPDESTLAFLEAQKKLLTREILSLDRQMSTLFEKRKACVEKLGQGEKRSVSEFKC